MGIELISKSKTPIEISSQEKSYIEDLLMCPVCYELRGPPTYQCDQGHTICHFCHPKVNGVCVLCRGKVPTNCRNRVLETLHNNTTFNCGNRSAGCMDLVRGDKFEEHMQICEFQQVKCRFVNDSSQCTDDKVCVPRQILGVIPHLIEDHRIQVFTSGQYCSHEEILELREDVDIPLALWDFDNVMFLEQITIREGIAHLCITQFLGNTGDKLKTEIYSVDMQLIRKGLDCAPNIRKEIIPMRICPFDKRMEDFSAMYAEFHFKTNIARCDLHLARKFCWISRLDFKIKSNK